VVGRDVIRDRGRRPREVLLLERLQGPAVPANEDRLRHRQRNQRGENQRAGEENEEADPTSTGTPVHDKNIIAAASSHSSAATAGSIRGEPIAASKIAAVPRAVAFLSIARKGRKRPGSRSGGGKGPIAESAARIRPASSAERHARRRAISTAAA